MASGDQLIFAGFAIAFGGFVAVLFFYIRSRHYVAKDKLHAVEDVSKLWKYGVPPKIALNEKGLRLCRYRNASFVILLIALGMVGVVAEFEASSRFNVLSAIIITIFYGSFLVGMFLRMAVTVFFIGMGIVFFGAIFGNDMPLEWGTNP